MRPAMSVMARTTPGSTVKSSWAAKRAARIIRSGSSEKDSSGRAGGAQHLRARGRSTPWNGSSNFRSGRVTAIALTVKSRRPRSPSERVAVGDRRLAGVRVVRVRAVRRDLDLPVTLAAADGAERPAHVPGGVRPAGEQPLGGLGSRRGGEVEVAGAAGRGSRREPVRRPGRSPRPRPRTGLPSSSMTGERRSSSRIARARRSSLVRRLLILVGHEAPLYASGPRAPSRGTCRSLALPM